MSMEISVSAKKNRMPMEISLSEKKVFILMKSK
jgi:hypothetical protein